MKKRALIIIDLQNGLETTEKKLYDLDNVLSMTNQRIFYYRQQKRPIIFIQHEDEDLVFGSTEWQLFERLDARPEDIYIGKTHANSFFKTKLSECLKELNIEALEFCGAQTEYCVDTTIRMAHGLGYTSYMKRGTTTTLSNDLLEAKTIIDHHERLWDQRFLTFF